MQKKKTVELIKKTKPVLDFKIFEPRPQVISSGEKKIVSVSNCECLEVSDDDRDEYGNPVKFIGDDYIKL